MQSMLRYARERVVLDLGQCSINGGAECRPMTWDYIDPEGGPCVPSPPVGTVLPAELLPETDEDEEMQLPRRVIVRDDGRWASLEQSDA